MGVYGLERERDQRSHRDREHRNGVAQVGEPSQGGAAADPHSGSRSGAFGHILQWECEAYGKPEQWPDATSTSPGGQSSPQRLLRGFRDMKSIGLWSHMNAPPLSERRRGPPPGTKVQ